jgi:uncharacterized membrane-anchored protein
LKTDQFPLPGLKKQYDRRFLDCADAPRRYAASNGLSVVAIVFIVLGCITYVRHLKCCRFPALTPVSGVAALVLLVLFMRARARKLRRRMKDE